MGLNVLFEGSNFERLLGGLWVTAKIAFVSVQYAYRWRDCLYLGLHFLGNRRNGRFSAWCLDVY